MKQRRPALVAHTDPGLRSQVEAALKGYGVATIYARNCAEVGVALSSRRSPDVIFTGSSFANGNWRDVLALARAARPPVDVVLTIDEEERSAEQDQAGTELDRLDAAAFDFVVLPFGADIGQLLAHRYAKPRAVQPSRWRKPVFPARRPPATIPSPVARFGRLGILGRAWTRATKLGRRRSAHDTEPLRAFDSTVNSRVPGTGSASCPWLGSSGRNASRVGDPTGKLNQRIGVHDRH
jgi:hypothetical protein